MVVVPSLTDGDDSASATSATVGSAKATAASHQGKVVSRSAVRTLRHPRRAAPQDNDQARAAALRIERREARELAREKRRKARLLRIKREKKRLARLAKMRKVSTFRVGALNILGSQHTRGKGRYGPGTTRAAISAGIIAARGVDVVTLSEVQDDQLAVLNNRMGGYSIWPQHALGSNGQRLQIAWRSSRFEMVDGGSVSFPFDRQSIPLPYVRLRDRSTQAEFWVLSVHNSARDLEGERDAATAIQISLMRRLMEESGKPVLIGGDVNEHEEFFYKVCQSLGFLAANGGGPGCALPPRPLRVDWIMGGGGAGVDFSGYVQDGSTLAQASDHYFIHADVSVTDPGEQ